MYEYRVYCVLPNGSKTMLPKPEQMKPVVEHLAQVFESDAGLKIDENGKLVREEDEWGPHYILIISPSRGYPVDEIRQMISADFYTEFEFKLIVMP